MISTHPDTINPTTAPQRLPWQEILPPPPRALQQVRAREGPAARGAMKGQGERAAQGRGEVVGVCVVVCVGVAVGVGVGGCGRRLEVRWLIGRRRALWWVFGVRGGLRVGGVFWVLAWVVGRRVSSGAEGVGDDEGDEGEDGEKCQDERGEATVGDRDREGRWWEGLVYHGPAGSEGVGQARLDWGLVRCIPKVGRSVSR